MEEEWSGASPTPPLGGGGGGGGGGLPLSGALPSYNKPPFSALIQTIVGHHNMDFAAHVLTGLEHGFPVGLTDWNPCLCLAVALPSHWAMPLGCT